MSFFMCSNCGDVDHTALTNYWLGDGLARRDASGPWCSQCDPRIGRRWHGRETDPDGASGSLLDPLSIDERLQVDGVTR